MVSGVLVYNGYHPIGCTHGGDGCKKAIDERFDLILLDVMLPTILLSVSPSAGPNLFHPSPMSSRHR